MLAKTRKRRSKTRRNIALFLIITFIVIEVGIDVNNTDITYSNNSQISYAYALKAFVMSCGSESNLVTSIQNEPKATSTVTSIENEVSVLSAQTSNSLENFELNLNNSQFQSIRTPLLNSLEMHVKLASNLKSLTEAVFSNVQVSQLTSQMSAISEEISSSNSDFRAASNKIYLKSFPTFYYPTWSLSNLETWATNLENSPVLNLNPIVTIETWDITPLPIRPSQNGQPSTIPPTNSISINIILGNTGGVSFSGGSVSFEIQDTHGSSSSGSTLVSLQPGDFKGISFNNIKVKPSMSYSVKIVAGPLNGYPLSGDEKTSQFAVAPSH